MRGRRSPMLPRPRGSRAPTFACSHAPASAFTLAEVVLTVLIIGIGLTASLRALTVILASSETSERALLAHRLSADLLAEISLLPFEDPDGSPVFGREPDEATATSRASFDDIDDYNGWSESPPQDKDGTIVPGTAGYTRSVAVASVDPADFAAVVAPGSSNAKRITVTTSGPATRPVSLVTVRLKGANREDLP